MTEVDIQQVEDALEKINNAVLIITETMEQSTPEAAGPMVEDMLNDGQKTHQFLENSAEPVIFQGEEALFDRMAETMEKYRSVTESYSKWVVDGTTQQAQGDLIDLEAPGIDERLMTSSIQGDFPPALGQPLATQTIAPSIDLERPGEVKKKRKDGKKKKDPKEPATIAPAEDFWNSWAGGENATFQETNLMDSGGWPSQAQEFPSSFGAFGENASSIPKAPCQNASSPSVIAGATFPSEAFPPKLVEQPLDTSHPSQLRAAPTQRVPEDAFAQSALPSGGFGLENTFVSPTRQTATMQSLPSTAIKNDRDARGSLPHPTRRIESPRSHEGPAYKASIRLPEVFDPVTQKSPKSGWISPASQKSPAGLSKGLPQEAPGTITVQMTLPRVNFADLPSSFNNLFVSELSDALNISDLRIRVLDVKPAGY